MRKLAVIGALAAGAMGTATSAVAATVDTLVSGTLANNTNTCLQVLNTLTTTDDCSYAATRYPGPDSDIAPSWTAWKGPFFASAFYPRGSVYDGDLTQISQPGDGKLAVPLVGTITIDDNDTPGDGSDDRISGTIEFGPAVHYAGTGQGDDSAIERWDKFTHTLAPTTVSSAVARAGGGFDYVIGSRGMPTPVPGPLAGVGGANTGTFPSETAKNFNPTNVPVDWEITGSIALPIGQRVGIERSAGFGNFDDTGANLQPNIGAQTTAVFENYQCEDDVDNQSVPGPDPDYDCSGSAVLLGSGQTLFLNEDGSRIAGTGSYLPTVPGGPDPGNCSDGNDNDGDTLIDAADPQCAPKTDASSANLRRPITPPGFDNLIMRVSTTSANRVEDAEAYWTREWVIASGSSIGNDPTSGPPGQRWATPNTWTGGHLTFAGCSLTGPAPADDDLTVTEGDTNVALPVSVNDTPSCSTPNTITIVTQPQHGTATVDGATILYTPSATEPAPNTFYDGPDSLTYKVTDNDLLEAQASVTITVAVKAPVASLQFGISDGGAALAKVVLTAGNLGNGTLAQHTIVPGAGTLGTCTVTGNPADTLVYTPTPNGGSGSGGCTYTMTDVEGDVSNTQDFIVDVRGNGAAATGNLPGNGSSLDALTLGALLAGLPLLRRRRRLRT